MDLWEYSKNDEEKYVLNKNASGNTDEPGYIGEFKNGKIIGNIPQYIKGKDDNQYVEVSSLRYTFFNCSELKFPPIIPETITNMSYTFKNSGITKIPTIPNNVQYLNWCFENTKITNSSYIIGDNVKSIEGMFYRCSELEEIYLEINFNIDSIAYALSNCPNLYGDIIINKIPTKYNNFFTNSALSDKILSLKGIGNELQQIYQTKSEESNIKMVSN